MLKRVASNKLKPNYYQEGILYHRFSLMTVGLIQVYFIAINTYFIAKEIYLGVAVASFIISLLWAFNVRKATSSTSYIDRIFYAVGATLGSVIGLWSSASVASCLLN